MPKRKSKNSDNGMEHCKAIKAISNEPKHPLRNPRRFDALAKWKSMQKGKITKGQSLFCSR